ncbi:MAG: hypothetical protein A2W99_11730 [Bacteroidetes bacterium GWF2_33_16]|nr:MAG: hypothetical protein A2X00_02545 [Bacteroidetes bacterium GWE2_32_14]OFY06369.1 MAG: hypothetical protein A2W99_11730 [Bacteroidetes bacterium GWF2_33_16]
MKVTPIYLSLLLFAIISCQPAQQRTDGPKIKENETWVKRSYYEKSGALKSEITVKNKKKNGPAKEYYPSGKLRSLVNYIDNITVGETIWYYENGQPFRITPYVDGKMNGIRKTYYDDGKIQAEIPFKDGEPMEGLKEYNRSGKLITSYPQIIFETKNNLNTENKIILICKLDKKAINVVFYQEVKNSENKTVLSAIPLKNGTPQLEFYIPSMVSVKKSIPIWVHFKTQLGNPYITMKEYQLNIDTN